MVARRPLMWEPIATGRRAQRAWKVIDALAATATRTDDPSLAEGEAGAALFLAYLARARGRPVPNAVHGRLRRALEQGLSDGNGRFLDGAPGIGWAAAHLRAPFGALLRGLDASVGLLARESSLPYDLGGGLAGLAVYAAERMPRRSAADTLGHVVRRLQRTAADGRLITPASHLVPLQAAKAPHGLLDLGMAHGLGGALAATAVVLAAGVEPRRCRRLLTDLRRALHGELRRARGKGLPSQLPLTAKLRVSRGTAPLRPRLAWCYGDPGAACALALLFRVSGEEEDRETARALMACATASHPLARTIASASLCHGLAGMLHLHNRAAQSLDAPELRRTAVQWMDELLRQRRLRFEEPPGKDGNGLLNGAPGVGLALLAAVSPVPPDWDRALLLSAR